MIPKKIHYCWFGHGEKSELAKKCIMSWNKYLSDYQIIEWNEDNFNISENMYVKEAYENKKYAFVSDYVRLCVLKQYGGIYFDTDVEVFKGLGDLLSYDFVVGFEADNRVGSAIIMAKPNDDYIIKWLNTYLTRRFVEKGKLDEATNVIKLNELLISDGWIMNGKTQVKNNRILIEKEKLYPYGIGEKKKVYTNSYMVHWCEGTWVSGKIKIKHNCLILLKKILGIKIYNYLRNLKNDFGKVCNGNKR